MSAAPRAVLFDVDNTICEYRRPSEELLPVAFERAGEQPFFTVEEYWDRYGELLGTVDRARMSELRERCFVALAAEHGRDPERAGRVAKAYEAARDHTNVRFLNGLPDVLDRLDDRYRLAAVTNGPEPAQSRKLEALGVDQFEQVVFAGFDAPPKPDPAPFERALSAVDASPAEAVFVGNSLEADVAGAHAAGLEAAWLRQGRRPEDGPTPEYVLETPADLLDPPWE